MLSQNQIDQYHRAGYVIVPELIPAGMLAAATAQLRDWEEESRSRTENYGFDTVNGRARFDLQPGHSAAAPMLRRVANPTDVSQAYRDVLWQGPVLEVLKDLIGADIRFHHSKTNTKAPGAATKVDWHQDHAFSPLSNPDMVTVLIMLNDMTEANGALKIVEGSHKEPKSHYRGGAFVGTISNEDSADYESRARLISGRAGDVCFMHTWAAHGGGNNRTDAARSLLIAEYMAADAAPLAESPIASRDTGRLLCGRDLKTARLVQAEVELPVYEDDSFFGLQEKAAAEGRPA